jgi:hypothetical protein
VIHRENWVHHWRLHQPRDALLTQLTLCLFSETSVRSVGQTAEAPSTAIRPLKRQIDVSIALLRENADRLKNPGRMMISIPEETAHLPTSF